MEKTRAPHIVLMVMLATLSAFAGALFTRRTRAAKSSNVLLLTTILVGINPRVVALDSNTVVQHSEGFYTLQCLITFDCLDGVILNPTIGTVTLLGHRSDPAHPMQVAYLDYLATALECQSPTFSLEWTHASYARVARGLQIASRAFLDSVTSLFDAEERLTPTGAWLLREAGADVQAGLSHAQACVRMLKALQRSELGEAVGRTGDWLGGNTLLSGMAPLAAHLGLEKRFREFEQKFQQGPGDQQVALDEFMPGFLSAVEASLEIKPGTCAKHYNELRLGGKSGSDVLNQIQDDLGKDLCVRLQRTLDELLGNRPEFRIPASRLESMLSGQLPTARPVFTDLPPHSLLAQLAFEADLLAKNLPCAPRIKNSIPLYRTLFEFERIKGRALEQSYEVFWIAPGRFELIQSLDGNAMRFGHTPMKFCLRKVAVDSSDRRTDLDEPLLDEYAAELSGHYDALARRFAILHTLLEAEKVVALARWIQERGVRLHLPKEGRKYWSPPEEVAGTFHLVLSYGSGKFLASTTAEGGVDLRPDRGWTILNGSVDVSRADSVILNSTDNEWHDLVEQVTRQAAAASNPKLKAATKMELAWLLRNTGDESGAVRELQDALCLDPSCPTLHLLSAELAASQGDLGGAEKELKEYLKFDPGNRAASRLLTEVRERITDPSAFTEAPNRSVLDSEVWLGGVSAWRWPEPESADQLSHDQRAPNLPDIHMAHFEPRGVPPPPSLPVTADLLQKDPILRALFEQRNQLTSQYKEQQNTESRQHLRDQIQEVDNETREKLKDYPEVFFETEAEPSTTPKQTSN